MAAIQRSISGLDVPIYCSADASASPMLSPTREADALTVSRARCAYRAVVRTWVWPSSFPIIGRLSPSPTAREAKAVTQLTDVGRRPHVRRVGRAGLLGALTAEKEGVSGYRRTRPRDRHARGRRPCPRAQTRRARALGGTVLAGGFDVDVAPRQTRVLSSATELKAGYSRSGQPRPGGLRRLPPGTGNGIGLGHRSAALLSGNQDELGLDVQLSTPGMYCLR